MNQSELRPISFLIPGDARSGGVRVTMLMANELLDRGYRVRIIYPRARRTVRSVLEGISLAFSGKLRDAGWLNEFNGEVRVYKDINDLEFRSDEVVISVGTYIVEELRKIEADVEKVRFNHGMPSERSVENLKAWSGDLPIITVSSTLIPELEDLATVKVSAVVPNGVDEKQYFVDPAFNRDGVGALISGHPNKAPRDMESVLRRLHEEMPDLPIHLFGTKACPASLSFSHYTQLPSVEKAREIYNRSKIWLVTSRTEGLPGVVLEAMSCGCVVASTDNAGSREIITHSEDGLLVPIGDTDELLRCTLDVLNDDARLLGLAEKSRQRASDFTWSKAADRMEDFLRSLTSAVAS